MGNPKIVQYSKEFSTGPRTLKGKLSQVLQNPLLVHGNYSKVIKKSRQCDKCPLGAKIVQRRIGTKLVDVSIPAKCNFYEKGKRKCDLPIDDWIKQARLAVTIGEQQETRELERLANYKLQTMAELNAQVDLATQGRFTYPTVDAQDKAREGWNKYNKLVYGEKRAIAAVVANDPAEDMMERLFGEKEKKERE